MGRSALDLSRRSRSFGIKESRPNLLREAKMAQVTEYKPGTFCWLELATTDSAGAKKFYTELFGWAAIDVPAGPGMIYTMLQLSGQNIGALYQMGDREKGLPPHWASYVSVANADESAEKARSLGGAVVMAPFDVMDIGRMSLIADPTGATFSLWQAGKSIGATVVNQPGAPTWNELSTTDTKAAGDFYTKLFGWTSEEMNMGPAGQYTIFKNGDRGAGGMYKITPEMGGMPPMWWGYFAVEDCDSTAARVTELGGVVMEKPKDIPGVGRFAIIQDPQGTGVAFIKLNNPEL
jgi:predicted enzyme related to lactoylglutathione lyase